MVIGNAAYPQRPLRTAAADAGLVAQALAQAGFDVTAAMDLDGKRLRAAFHTFSENARDAGPGATILVYLSGYGVQYDGDNYLVPVDATLAHDDDVPLQAVDLDDYARALAALPAAARILDYDLARTTPFAAGDEMPLAPGLALGTPPAGTLIAFNAAPGMVAPDAAPPYFAYARALAEGLATPGLSPALMLERVRLRVGTLTDGAQVPWTEGALDPGAPLVPGAAPAAAPAIGPTPADAYAAVIARDSLEGYADFLRAVPDGPLAARVRVLLAVRREATMWRAAATAEPRALWTYLRRYPRGPHRFDARRRLAALRAQLEPPPRFDPFVFPDLPAPTDAELALLEQPGEALASLAPIPAPPATLLPDAGLAYAEALPPPAPAPAGILPIAAPLPQAGDAGAGRITQTPPGSMGAIVTRTTVAPGGGAELTLSGTGGTLVTLATIMARDGTRTIIETGPKNAVLSRTTTTQVGDAVTTVQADGSGRILTKLTARGEADGSRVVRVVDGADALVAEWRRDAGGIVVARETAKPVEARAPVPAPAAIPAAPTSPTVAVAADKAPPSSAPAPAFAPPRPVAAPVPSAASAQKAPPAPAPSGSGPSPSLRPPVEPPSMAPVPVGPAPARPMLPSQRSPDLPPGPPAAPAPLPVDPRPQPAAVPLPPPRPGAETGPSSRTAKAAGRTRKVAGQPAAKAGKHGQSKPKPSAKPEAAARAKPAPPRKR